MKSTWFVFQHDKLLFYKKHSLPNEEVCRSIKPFFLRSFNLGTLQDVTYHCAEISVELNLNELFDSILLRQALTLLDDSQYRLAAKAWSVINWDRNHQFCSRCGVGTVHLKQNFERTCPACDLSFFPRISPSIIVLIKKEDEVLMARSPHFPPGVYALIAGFVDPGERIEDTVHREVMEEVGLEIKNLKYYGSQSWPFPDSLMLAFTADYASGEITMDPNEIEDAGWYKYNQLPGLPSSPISISMKLLNDFISKQLES